MDTAIIKQHFTKANQWKCRDSALGAMLTWHRHRLCPNQEVALQGKLCGSLLGQARVGRAKLQISSSVKLNLTPLFSGDWELSSQHALYNITVSPSAI